MAVPPPLAQLGSPAHVVPVSSGPLGFPRPGRLACRGFRPVPLGGWFPSGVRGSSGDPLALIGPPATRLAASRARARSLRLRHLALLYPPAGSLCASSGIGAADGTVISGPTLGGRTCRHTWCRASSLCFRATRAACFSSLAFHSSNTRWLRSAACPAAQVAATHSSSGVSPGSSPSSWGVDPAAPSPYGSRSAGGPPCSQFASRTRFPVQQVSQW